MTNKEFFLKRFAGEKKVFARVFAAVPEEHRDYKPDPKSKTAVELSATIASEIADLAVLVKQGTVDHSAGMPPRPSTMPEIVALFETGATALDAVLASTTDEEWENKTLTAIYPMGKWESKMFDICWGLLFDVVHHRGQLSTYLRAMGGKVPSIYGPSADSAPEM
jgi:uncharacterized damage-inducible protein DinB